MFEIAYKVKYSTPVGVVVEITRLENHNKLKLTQAQALSKKLGINENQILSTSTSVEVGVNNDDIKQHDLPVVLISLYSAALSGKVLITALTQVLDGIYSNKNLQNKLKLFKLQGLSLSETLKRLNVHSVVTALINSGEHTGDVAQSLLSANDFLVLDEKTKKASKTGIGKSFYTYFSA